MISQRQLFLQHIAQTSDAPLMLEIERAEGSLLYDTEGKAYIDLISGISVSNIGHSHPKVKAAVKAQMDKYMHLMVYGEYVQSPQVRYADLLTNHLPEKLNTVYFTNSGAEATEGALKLAKRHTGRSEIIYCKHSYHGSTMGALSVLGDEYFRRNYRPLIPGNIMIHYNDENELGKITEQTAAIILEPIQAESGITVPAQIYLQKVRERCNGTGTLMIVDEAQTGMGRTGKLFAFEHFNVVPDILLSAKALGGGMPLGAFISSQEIMQSLQDNPVLGHITTFGGHPVCCAAGLAALKVILEEDLIKGVVERNQLLNKKLQHAKIKANNNFGLMMALQFDNYNFNKKIIDKSIEKGLITDWFLFNDSALRIAPPLNIPLETLEKACNTILESLDEIE